MEGWLAGLERWGSRAASLLLALVIAGVLVLQVGPALLPYRVFTVLSGSMSPTIPIGSEVLDTEVPAAELKPGDVITFPDPHRRDVFVTHRITRIEKTGAVAQIYTRGDANGAEDTWNLRAAGTYLRVAAHVPFLGYVLHALNDTRTRLGVFAVLALLALLVLWEMWGGEREDAWAR